MSEASSYEFNGFRNFWKFDRMGIDDGNFIKFKVPLNQWQRPLADGAVPNDADIVDLTVYLLCFHKKFNSL